MSEGQDTFAALQAHMTALRAAKKATPRAWQAFTEYEDVGDVLLDVVGQVVCAVNVRDGGFEAVYAGQSVLCGCRSEAWERAEEMARADGWDIDERWGDL